jgi:NADH-quinone oxidoreductase subunit N
MQAAAAEIFMLSAVCVILLIDVFLSDRNRWITYALSLLAVAGAAGVTLAYGVDSRVTAFDGMFIADPMGDVLKLFSYGATAVSFLYSREYLQRRGLFKGEYFVLGLVALLGVMVLISAGNLLTVYLGIELMSLSLYALVAFNRDSSASAESAMKFFVLGAIASGCLLYGISMLYGATGTIDFTMLTQHLSSPNGLSIPAVLGLVFIIVGVAFKFGAVPFHMWIPDVYQGAPTPVTLYVGSAPKIAAFALAWRILVDGLGPLHPSWGGMLTVLCVLSLGIGNVLAIAQTNLKRMLGYSTIAHVGFILMGFIAGTPDGIQSAMYYTLAYVLMATAAFGMIILLSRRGFEAENLDDFKGLNARSPWFAFVMLMVMFSFAGVPPMIGFYAKLVVLESVINVGLVWLAAVGVLFAVIGAFYYLRVVWYMYFAEPVDNTPLAAASDMRLVMSANGLALLALGIFPSVLLGVVTRVLS